FECHAASAAARSSTWRGSSASPSGFRTTTWLPAYPAAWSQKSRGSATRKVSSSLSRALLPTRISKPSTMTVRHGAPFPVTGLLPLPSRPRDPVAPAPPVAPPGASSLHDDHPVSDRDPVLGEVPAVDLQRAAVTDPRRVDPAEARIRARARLHRPDRHEPPVLVQERDVQRAPRPAHPEPAAPLLRLIVPEGHPGIRTQEAPPHPAVHPLVPPVREFDAELQCVRPGLDPDLPRLEGDHRDRPVIGGPGPVPATVARTERQHGQQQAGSDSVGHLQRTPHYQGISRHVSPSGRPGPAPARYTGSHARIHAHPRERPLTPARGRSH